MLNPEFLETSELPTSRYRTPGAMTDEPAQWKLEHHQHELGDCGFQLPQAAE